MIFENAEQAAAAFDAQSRTDSAQRDPHYPA
jgi:hypothetical protein